MLDYEWVNPSTIILAGNETVAGTDSDQTHREIFDHNYTMLPDPILHSSTTPTNSFSHNHHFSFNPPQPNNHHQPSFDPRAFRSASTTSFSLPPPMLSLNPISPLETSNGGIGFGHGHGLGLLLMTKSENAMNFEGPGSGSPGLGLNLGGPNYFASCNENITNRLSRTAKTAESVSAVSSNSPRCQVKGCNADLSEAKHYHRRHKVCEYHSKAATVVAAGLTQRFCQQCSRFHLLSEFDNGKRSCRKRLADHNRRRRKTQQAAQDINKSQPSLDNVARPSPESGSQSWSSSLKLEVSPPDYFQGKTNRK